MDEAVTHDIHYINLQRSTPNWEASLCMQDVLFDTHSQKVLE